MNPARPWDPGWDPDDDAEELFAPIPMVRLGYAM